MASGIVLGGSLYCRKTADSNAGYYGKFSTGTFLTVESYNDTWYSTKWTNGSAGYVMKAYVACAGDTVKVTSNAVNVRNSPSTSGTAVLYQLNSGATATVKSVATGWVQITPSGKSTGWISASYVTKSSSGGSGGSGGTITDDGSTGDNTSNYYGAKCVGNINVYERDNPNVFVLQYYGLLSGSISVTDPGDGQWMNYSNDGKVYRKQIDITYSKKPATVTMGSSTLSNGSSNRYVYHLQHYLNRYLASRNYAKITVDGQFGSTTAQKVESFQNYWNSTQSIKLEVDGVVGSNTRTALAKYVHTL